YSGIEQKVNTYTGYLDRLDDILGTRLFGLVINKSDAEEADPVAEEFVERVSRIFSLRMTYLGHIPEARVLRNISNYQMPFVIFDPEHSVMEHFCKITDKIIGLKNGSSEKIIHDQLEFMTTLKMQWLKNVSASPALY
ncbi:MinD/ParA family protein, partial [candidate division KSB1 bacterium]